MKSKFLKGFLLSMTFGLVLSLTITNADAVEELTHAGDKIPCYSSGNSNPYYKYVDCATCTRTIGNASGGKGQCTN